MDHYGAGVNGEQLAREYLEAQGMRFLAARFRGGSGEIDLVMEDGQTLVLV